jgi:hypothetical protein
MRPEEQAEHIQQFRKELGDIEYNVSDEVSRTEWK